jgi:uncharacterized LabA/DUF88 family protein
VAGGKRPVSRRLHIGPIGGESATTGSPAKLSDSPKIKETAEALKKAGIEAPRVFKKTKDRGSKGVDIALATDMLGHAHRKHYDLAILVAGDGDYVPLVEAVQREGALVHVWFLQNGLSPSLQMAADGYADITGDLLTDSPERRADS